MVQGASIRLIIDYVSKKKGIEGLNALGDIVNKDRVIFMKESDIKHNENYPGHYLAKILDATVKIFDENELQEMGKYFGEHMDVNFKGILGKYPPKKTMENIVLVMRKYLPIFHTGYKSITSKSYWLLVSKLKKEYYPFIDGITQALFEKHGGIREVKKAYEEDRIEYTLKF